MKKLCDRYPGRGFNYNRSESGGNDASCVPGTINNLFKTFQSKPGLLNKF